MLRRRACFDSASAIAITAAVPEALSSAPWWIAARLFLRRERVAVAAAAKVIVMRADARPRVSSTRCDGAVAGR